MVTPLDLQDFDVGWIATDAIGQVALFTTAGPGPIPDSALPSVEISEELVLSLPEVSDVDLVTSMSGANAFVAFAKRGFFAYDWSDVHRAARQALNGYELQYRPLNPLTLFDLPAPLRALAEVTRLSGVTFGASIVVIGDQVS
ncbi:hypothetical protein NUH87_29115 [Pseudomonas batumici]|uniref:hypothetical protein n=1 Tax=Pseudomonas batumici TaxID=226910 RepID=UPI0030CE844C